jgi:5S rRNA maturation endonuclease (ribonuclease M5)
LIDKHERAMQAFGVFILGFIRDLNHLADEGWSVLVEGQRDEKALLKLGYRGGLVTIPRLGRRGASTFGETKKVVILTDLDREGQILTARFVKRLEHEGMIVSLSERRRLKAASRGIFLHVENLSRFDYLVSSQEERSFGLAAAATRQKGPRRRPLLTSRESKSKGRTNG